MSEKNKGVTKTQTDSVPTLRKLFNEKDYLTPFNIRFNNVVGDALIGSSDSKLKRDKDGNLIFTSLCLSGKNNYLFGKDKENKSENKSSYGMLWFFLFEAEVGEGNDKRINSILCYTFIRSYGIREMKDLEARLRFEGKNFIGSKIKVSFEKASETKMIDGKDTKVSFFKTKFEYVGEHDDQEFCQNVANMVLDKKIDSAELPKVIVVEDELSRAIAFSGYSDISDTY